MNSAAAVLLLFAAVLTVSTVLGCSDFGLAGCTTAHGTKLTARRVPDEIEKTRNYAKSCEYIQDWYWCIADKREGCGDGNRNLKAYNNEYDRLRETPYNCTVSGTSSLMISVTSLAVMLMAAIKMA